MGFCARRNSSLAISCSNHNRLSTISTRVRHPHRALIPSAALATVSETGVRSFCDHDAVFAPTDGDSSLQATIYARRTLHLRRVGRGQKQIGHWSWHEQIDLQHRKDTVKTRLLPDGRLHGGRQSSRMCVMGKGTRCLTLVPRHLHSPRASVAGRCLQMLRVCNILYCIALHWPQCLRHRSSRLSV